MCARSSATAQHFSSWSNSLNSLMWGFCFSSRATILPVGVAPPIIATVIRVAGVLGGCIKRERLMKCSEDFAKHTENFDKHILGNVINGDRLTSIDCYCLSYLFIFSMPDEFMTYTGCLLKNTKFYHTFFRPK